MDFTLLHERMDRACARAQQAAGDPASFAEINDVLSEGYAEALLAEAELIRLEEQLADQIGRTGPGRAEAVRRLMSRQLAAERAVAALRSHLAVTQERFVGLGGPARLGAR